MPSLLKSLQTIPKSFFSLSDIKKFYRGKEESLPVLLHRLVQGGKLERLMRSYYALNGEQIDWEAFACVAKKPSYLSLESALYHYGLLNQIPETITLVTTGKSQSLQCKGKILEYVHIKNSLFFGYEIKGDIMIAKKEKALLDDLYLIALKKRTLSCFPSWFSQLDQKLFQSCLKHYPPFVKKLYLKIIAP